MSCPDAHVLSRYYDEMIGGEEQRRVTKHISSCIACQRVLALYDGEAQFIKATLREPSLPAQFVEEVLREVTPHKEWRWLQISCVVVILLITVLLCADVVR